MRITKKKLESAKWLLEYYTDHKITLHFSDGCGVCFTLDGEFYSKEITKGENKGTYVGFSNKYVYELMRKLSCDAIWFI